MTDKDEIFHRVRDVVCEILMVSADEVNLETVPEDIKAWDSMQHLNVMLALEQSCGVHFKPEDFAEMNSVAAIVEGIAATRI